MKFSILIAHYNNWNYFQECYQSIVNQSYRNFEIVIVDDCSTDGSFEKLQELAKKDSRIKLFRNSENKKVGYTKRRCVEESLGDISGFVDPDDKLSHNALNEVINVYKNNKNAVVTYSKIKLINSESKEIGEFKHSKKIINNKKYFFNINFEVAHFFTFKNDVYKQISGIDESLSSAVDQDLYLKLYEKGDFFFINEYQYYYRNHEKGVSQDKTKKKELHDNWHKVIFNTCERRDINKIFGENVKDIESLPKFIFGKENTLFKRIVRKIL